jgi:hypothetical protein
VTVSAGASEEMTMKIALQDTEPLIIKKIKEIIEEAKGANVGLILTILFFIIMLIIVAAVTYLCHKKNKNHELIRGQDQEKVLALHGRLEELHKVIQGSGLKIPQINRSVEKDFDKLQEMEDDNDRSQTFSPSAK